MRLRNRGGFTIIGVLLAIALTAGLAVLTLDSSSKHVDESRLSKAIAEVSTIEIALSQYNLDHPTAKITASTGWSSAKSALRNGGYLDILPEYDGTFGCSYSMYSTGYTDASGKTTPHVQLSGCSFATNYQSGGTTGVIRMYASGSSN